jgi:GDPmannose 4,6-dehydratase
MKKALITGITGQDGSYLAEPTEVDYLQGDSSKARRLLGRRPSILFEELVHSMVENGLELARRDQTLIAGGHKVVHRGEVAYA